MDNVALEFDPNWALEVEKAGPDDRDIEIVDILATAAMEGADWGHICTIWLIDYGIKRNPEAPIPAERGVDAMFYQGERRLSTSEVPGHIPNHLGGMNVMSSMAVPFLVVRLFMKLNWRLRAAFINLFIIT